MTPSFSPMLRKLPIRRKLTLIIIGICISTLLITTFIQMVFSFFNEREQLSARLATTAEIISVQSTASLEFVDPMAARENLSSLRIQPTINRACIYNEAGAIFASYVQAGSISPSQNNVHCPDLQIINTAHLWSSLNVLWDIRSGKHKIGTLYLEYDLTSMYHNMFNIWLFDVSLIIAASLLAYWVSFYLQRLISMPILELSKTTRKFSLTHDYSIRAVKYSEDELGTLADDFNAMIAELKKHETELEEAIEELTQSNTELERFAYICSHDLQEPLRMVSNYTQMLATRHSAQLDSDALEYMGFIVEGASHMRELINDILTYSRIAQHQTEQPRLVNLEEIKDIVLRNLALVINETDAAITIEPLPSVYGYKSLFIQLFQNLISNAIKFSKNKVCKIEVRARHSGRYWEFAVQDSGIGIDPQYHEKVFEIFKRLNRREEYKGTGIGLAICKKVVETHGGTIWIQSALGEGTTFFFTIPDTSTNYFD
jgi:signal transduction histidine kinase